MLETRAPKKTLTFKMWEESLKELRMLYALTGRSMVSIVALLIKRELERVREEQGRGGERKS